MLRDDAVVNSVVVSADDCADDGGDAQCGSTLLPIGSPLRDVFGDFGAPHVLAGNLVFRLNDRLAVLTFGPCTLLLAQLGEGAGGRRGVVFSLVEEDSAAEATAVPPKATVTAVAAATAAVRKLRMVKITFRKF